MKKKYLKLGASIVIDLMGALPAIAGALAIPLTGGLSFLASESFDIIWAPISGLLVFVLYKKSSWSLINFGEEILPGTDILPVATIAWLVENKKIK